MATYSARTFRTINRQAIQDVLDWFVFTDDPPPQKYLRADPWKRIIKFLLKWEVRRHGN